MGPAQAVAAAVTKKHYFLKASEIADPLSLVPFAAPWIWEAGNPYFNWLFGNPELALVEISKWIMRNSSEVFIGRVEFLLIGQDIAGGYIALNGRDLRTARMGDTEALWRSVDPPGRVALMERMATSAKLFPHVAEDQFYLSKMGLLGSHRKKGLARAIVQRFVDDGRAQGYTRFRLDVEAQNRSAIRSYRAMGFETFATSQSPDEAFQYLSMRLPESHAPSGKFV